MREEDADRLAAQHLLSLGHRRLAHVAGPLDSIRRAGAEMDLSRRPGRLVRTSRSRRPRLTNAAVSRR